MGSPMGWSLSTTPIEAGCAADLGAILDQCPRDLIHFGNFFVCRTFVQATVKRTPRKKRCCTHTIRIIFLSLVKTPYFGALTVKRERRWLMSKVNVTNLFHQRDSLTLDAMQRVQDAYKATIGKRQR
jgi:hypothetical protein